MADITDPIVLKFLNERTRPRMEQIRAVILALVDEDLSVWNSQVEAMVPADASPIVDGRLAEGVSQITGAELHAIMAKLADLRAQLSTQGAIDVINKTAVRPLNVTIPG